MIPITEFYWILLQLCDSIPQPINISEHLLFLEKKMVLIKNTSSVYSEHLFEKVILIQFSIFSISRWFNAIKKFLKHVT